MSDAVLTLNLGSSNLKFGLYEDRNRLLAGRIEIAESFDPDALLAEVDHRLAGRHVSRVGHRIVHGGPDMAGPAFLDDASLRRLEKMSPVAPLHQPQALALVRAMMAKRPGLPQIGCFDTAFHATLAPEVRRYALPRAFETEGLRRYGFHGLSYEHVADELRRGDPGGGGGRVVAAHLGAGSSLCAMHGGRSVDTSMGFTPLDGVAMATRCGALDPGLLLYLLQQRRMPPAEIEDLLYRRSGLLGVSGISADMRVLLASQENGAREAIQLYVFRVVREIGALAASLGGLDGLVFTGGIGQNAPEIRRLICARLGWLGIFLDEDSNAANAAAIGASSAVPVLVIPADEESVIARQTLSFTGG